MDADTNVQTIIDSIGAFIDERNWNSYHDPKNLSMSISIEAAELMEIFQWIDNNSALALCREKEIIDNVKDEVADIIIYSLSLCRVLKIDVSSSISEKIRKNREKYPPGRDPEQWNLPAAAKESAAGK